VELGLALGLALDLGLALELGLALDSVALVALAGLVALVALQVQVLEVHPQVVVRRVRLVEEEPLELLGRDPLAERRLAAVVQSLLATAAVSVAVSEGKSARGSAAVLVALFLRQHPRASPARTG